MNAEKLPRSFILGLSADFIQIEREYKFSFPAFRISRLNYRIDPPAAPIFWAMIQSTGRIVDCTVFAKEVFRRCVPSGYERFISPRGYWYQRARNGSVQIAGKWYRESDRQAKNAPRDAVFARSRQFWTGFLREIDVAIRLSHLDPKGTIYKDLDSDLGRGRVDLHYQRGDGKMFHLAIGHEGESSEEYADSRKGDKAIVNITELIAPNPKDDKLHLVKEEDLLSLVELDAHS